MKQNWTYKKLGDVLIFDKRFKGITKIDMIHNVILPKIA